MKISIITAVYNRKDYIGCALSSLRNQTYKDVEHVVVDGSSTDGTVELLTELLENNTKFISEPDGGLYDALNKGLSLATGDVIGLLHSDDFYANSRVLEDVCRIFNDETVDAVYGDLDFVSRVDSSDTVRRWRSCDFTRGLLARGWMPPHPTLFLRSSFIKRMGFYDKSFKISADYDAILRYFANGEIRSVYLPQVLIKMRVGGMSNYSLRNLLIKSIEDYRALRKNGVGGFFSLVLKNLSKIPQLLIG